MRSNSLASCTGKRGSPNSCNGKAILRAYVENAVGLGLVGHLNELDQLRQVEAREVENAAATKYQEAVAARDKVTDALADLKIRQSLENIQPAAFRRAKDKLLTEHAAADANVKAAAVALATLSADPDLLRSAMKRG